MYLYLLFTHKSDRIYVGVTKNLKSRLSSHKHAAKTKNTKLYNHMRKYGPENYVLLPIGSFTSESEMLSAEVQTIEHFSKSGIRLLNTAPGGKAGYIVPGDKRDEWMDKLKLARQGRKPALGMKHTEKNKRFFSECSKRKVNKFDSDQVVKYPFRLVREIFGISKTHYYRLLRTTSNESSGT